MSFLNWVSGFFTFNNDQSSKRLVGIIGSFSLFITMFMYHTDILVQCTTVVSLGALGITATEKIFSKNNTPKEDNKPPTV